MVMAVYNTEPYHVNIEAENNHGVNGYVQCLTALKAVLDTPYYVMALILFPCVVKMINAWNGMMNGNAVRYSFPLPYIKQFVRL